MAKNGRIDYITTNLENLTREQIEKIVKARWSIEVYHRESTYLEIRTVEQQLLNVCINFMEQNFPSEDKQDEIFKTPSVRNSFLDTQNNIAL